MLVACMMAFGSTVSFAEGGAVLPETGDMTVPAMELPEFSPVEETAPLLPEAVSMEMPAAAEAVTVEVPVTEAAAEEPVQVPEAAEVPVQAPAAEPVAVPETAAAETVYVPEQAPVEEPAAVPQTEAAAPVYYEEPAAEAAVPAAEAVVEEVPEVREEVVVPSGEASPGLGTVSVVAVSASAQAAVVNQDTITFSAQVVYSTSYLLYYRLYRSGALIAEGPTPGNSNVISFIPDTAGLYSIEFSAWNYTSATWESSCTSGSVFATSAFGISYISANANTIVQGNAMFFVPVMSGGTGYYDYTYSIYKGTTLLETNSGSVTPSDTMAVAYTPTDIGTYTCSFTITDKLFGTVQTASSGSISVIGQLTIASIQPSTLLTTTSNSVSFTSTVSGGLTPYAAYAYTLYRDGVAIDIKNDTSNTYTMSEAYLVPGNYQLQLVATDAGGNTASAESPVVRIIDPIVISAVTVSAATINPGGSTNVMVNCSSGIPDSYRYDVIKDNQVISTTTSTSPVYVFAPTTTGTYTVAVTGIVTNGTASITVAATSPAISVVDQLILYGVTTSSTAGRVGYPSLFQANVTGLKGDEDYVFRFYLNGSTTPMITVNTKDYYYWLTPSIPGTYVCEVLVKNSTVTSYLSAYSNTVEVYPELVVRSIVPNANNIGTGSPITFTVDVTGGTEAYVYLYGIYKGDVLMKAEYSYSNSYVYVPETEGVYTCTVYVYDTPDYCKSATSQNVTAISQLSAVTVSASTATPYVGEKLTLNVQTVGNALYLLYQIYENGNLVVNQASNSGTFEYVVPNQANYAVQVLAYDGISWIASGVLNLTSYQPFNYTTVHLSRYSAQVGDSILIGTDIAGGVPAVEYIYCVYDKTKQVVYYAGTESIISYTFDHTGLYRFVVYAKDARHDWVMHELHDLEVTNRAAVEMLSVTPDVTTANIGDTITWTVATAGTPSYYIYCVFRDGQQLTMDYSYGTSYSYTVTAGGSYTLTAYVTDGSIWAHATSVPTTVAAYNLLTIASITGSPATTNTGSPLSFTTTVTGNVGTVTYIYCLFVNGQQLTMAYSYDPTFTYTPYVAGTYYMTVFVCDERVSWINATSNEMIVIGPSPVGVAPTLSGTLLTAGDSVTVTANAAGGVPPYQYIYCLFRGDTQLTQDSTTATSMTYTLDVAGTYRIDVYCCDQMGQWTMKSSSAIVVTSH